MGHLLFDATLLGTGSSKTSLYMALGVDIWNGVGVRVLPELIKSFGVTTGGEMAIPHCPSLVVLTLLWATLVKPPAPYWRHKNFKKMPDSNC